MKFNTAYKEEYKIVLPEPGPRITDTTGYISPNIRIETMIDAGERLVEYRDDQATILDELYADERALPYNPTELQMLEINSLTSKSALRALERLKEYQEATAAQNKAAMEQPEAKNEGATEAKNEAKKDT